MRRSTQESRIRVVSGAMLALALGCAAAAPLAGQARAAPGASPPTFGASLSRNTTPAPLTLRERRGLKPGMVVIDRRGAKIATILQTNQTRYGRPAVLLDVNGAQFRVLASKLRLTRDGEEAIIALTRSQIRTSAILNTE